MVKINLKTPEEIEIMRQGGAKLREIKNALVKRAVVGATAEEVEGLANSLIEKSGGEASFKMVKDYKWCTCINVNDGVVHGIPHPSIVFKKGDVVSIDVGLFYKGFHTDTSVSLVIGGPDSKFLTAGRQALNAGISKAKKGKRIYDISEAIEDVLVANGYTPIRALVGHGVGRELHEDPQIPCLARGPRQISPEIKKGAVFAIEVMYAEGSGDVYIDASDGWTIATKDGKMSALFEETVAITDDGPLVLT